MHLLSIQKLLCCALLIGLASAAQNKQRSNAGEFNFKDEDSAIEGSGYNGEVNHDLESSGSGLGPDSDDEDGIHTEITHHNVPVINNPPPQPKIPETTERKEIIDTKVRFADVTTEDTGVIMNPKPEDRPTSFFAQPGIIAAVVGGAVVGLLCAILVVMFIVYRMRKKDEGSYALGEPKQSPNSNSYSRGTNKEFFA